MFLKQLLWQYLELTDNHIFLTKITNINIYFIFPSDVKLYLKIHGQHVNKKNKIKPTPFLFEHTDPEAWLLQILTDGGGIQLGNIVYICQKYSKECHLKVIET